MYQQDGRPIRIGVLDVGSNSAHLRIIDAYPGGPPLPVYRHKSPTYLAEAIDERGCLTRGGLDRLTDAVRQAGDAARRQRVDELIVLATATLRQAVNAAEIHDHVHKASGIDLCVLSGEDEARLTFLAAHRWLGWSVGPFMVIDIGGGSTEIAYGRDEDPDWAVSVPVGAGQLTRAMLPQHPARNSDVAAAREHVAHALSAVRDRLKVDAGTPAVATSKTFKQLARLTGAAPWKRGLQIRRRLTRQQLHDQISRLAKLSPAQRATLKGIATARSRQILAGAIIADTVMKTLGLKQLDVLGWGVREGILLRRLGMLSNIDRDQQLTLLRDAHQPVRHIQR
ncbi:MAG TPA: hypothetical protein VFC19_04560 [Candidatus Limnocylindrales bacterium]|nr:hypothetical protein [Candidatus Limnocylindrales bacterium]